MITYTIPLGNFDRQEQTTLDLGDAKVVGSEELSQEFLDYVMESFTKRKELIDLNPPKFYLQMDLADAVLENDGSRRRPLDRALAVFKLFKDGLVKSNIVFVQQNGVTNSLLWRHYVRWTHPETIVPIYILNQSEEPSFREFWREFASIDPTNFAIYRFHLADFRPYMRDRLADYVESLEYLLVPDSGEGEIGYKFRTRGALAIGTGTSRQQVCQDLDDLYDLRSAIVHGITERENKILRKKASDEIEALEAMISAARDYDRQLIVLFFRAGCYDDRDERIKFATRKSLCI